MTDGLTHFDPEGNAVMVDVSTKPVTERRAAARCVVRGFTPSVRIGGDVWFDEVLVMAKVAGMQGAKQTSRLIPLCHPLPLSATTVEIVPSRAEIEIRVATATSSQTGVEMEALTACAVAALSVIAALRQLHPDIVLDDLCLLEKEGGRSGRWRRDEPGYGSSETLT